MEDLEVKVRPKQILAKKKGMEGLIKLKM